MEGTRLQSPAPLLRIGTRGSPLALAQANLVRSRLAATHGVAETEIEIVVISTSGDRIRDRPLSTVGGKGLFTKEIEEALFSRAIDLGVHSAKDVATTLPPGLVLAAYLEREDVRDAFVSLKYATLDDLPEGAILGSSSIRRGAQMLSVRPDLHVIPFRGNVETRLQKLADGVADATLLAVAGLNRLNRHEHITTILDPERFPPAPAQGAITLEIRADDARTAALLTPLDHGPTRIAVLAERALLKQLDGSCRTPIGVLSRLDGSAFHLTGEILNLAGSLRFRASEQGASDSAEQIGARLGETLLAMAGPDFLDSLREPSP
jgi:hydroxymethylbilane synthase